MKTSNDSKRTPSRLRQTRGSALMIVMLLTGFTMIVLTAYLARSVSQKRINTSATYLAEARNGAEGVAEYAVAEVERRAIAFSSMMANPLSGWNLTTNNKLFISPEDPVTHISTDGLAHVVQSSLEYKCSNLSDRPSSPMLIDSSDPVNKDDIDKDKTLSVRSLNLFAKASVTDYNGKTITSYVAENLQVREQSWLNYAVFYNMDMEFHAGPDFTITGPVHTNANAYVVEGAGNTFSAMSTFSAKGQIFRKLKYNNSITFSGNTFSGTVNFISAAGANVSDLKPMAAADDSTRSGWLSYSQGRWNYFVQDTAYGVKTFAPDGMPTYTPDDFSTVAVELRNNAWLLIEPQLSTTVANAAEAPGLDGCIYPQGRYGQKRVNDVDGNPDPNGPENIKFSALAGFIVKVEPITLVTDTPKWKLCFPITTVANTPVSKQNLPTRETDGTPKLYVLDPFARDELDGVPVAQQKIKRDLKRRLLAAISYVEYRESAGSFGNGTGSLFAYPNPIPKATGLSSDSSNVNNDPHFAIYDRRQGNIYLSAANNGLRGAYHLLRIDLGLLNTLIRDTAAASSGLWINPSTGVDCKPANTWSGVVYVEMPNAQITNSRFSAKGGPADADMIRPAQAPTVAAPGYAVALVNAGTLPRMDQDLSKRGDGFSLATNGPLYIVGHYNADGNLGTGSSTTPDAVATTPTATSELPALIAADAVTILSAGWGDSDFQQSTTTKPNAATTEVSTAILTGLVPTKPGVQAIWSAGVHNLVRYLENWGGSTYRYRGSLAALFESEVAIEPYHEDEHPWYDPPTRQMGYHQYLAQGWFPPGTPIKRSVRRMNMKDIYQSEYDAGPVKPAVAN